MKQYGYDKETGALFSWEHDFRYEGTTLRPPEGAFESEDRVDDEAVGCAVMSGWSGTFIVLRSDGKDEHYCLFGLDQRTGLWKGRDIGQDNLRKMSSRMPVCVCGEIVRSPEAMAALCVRFLTSRMYACPLVEELAAFGALARRIQKNPYRVILDLDKDNRGIIDAECKTFDPKLEDGDAMGRMAEVVAHGLSAVNEVKTVVGVSPFYGKTLHREHMPGAGDRVIVRIAEMDNFFPQVPISAKNYVATSVSVQMATTEQFRQAAGYNGEVVDVFVATDYMPGVSVFMRFYKTLSGRGFVFVSEQDAARHGRFVPVFRSDKTYRVPKDKYEQSLGLLRREQGSGGRSNPA